MMKYVLHVFFTIITLVAHTQNAAQLNHTKYWYLKNRLNHYFLVIGDDYNMSIPATIRNRVDHSSIGESGGGFDVYGDLNSVRGFALDYTDAPQQIGLYLATLATEYKLLKLNHQNTSKVIKKLFYALYAINRLDDCESEYPWTGNIQPVNHYFNKNRKYIVNAQTANNLNGKMLRGEYYRGNPNDLENFPGFVEKYNQELNEGVEYYYNSVNNLGNPQGNPKKVTLSMLIEGGTLNVDFNDPNFLNPASEEYAYYSGDKVEKLKSSCMMSQDHYAKILLGLAFVVKFVESSETHLDFQFQDGETGLKNEAAKIAHRICSALANDGYRLKRPDGATLPEMWGGDARGFSYGYASAGKWIVSQIGMEHWSNSYFNEVTSNFEYIGWRNVIIPSLLTSEEWRNNLWIYLSLACVNDQFGSHINTNNYEMFLYSSAYDWQPFYTLAHSLLHNKTCLTNQSKIEEHLNQMPCAGPYNFYDQFFGGWCTPRRYHNNHLECSDHKGNFNGLEWMLLYNMYVLHEKLKNPNSIWAQTNYMDLMDRDINIDFPLTNEVNLGSTDNPLEIYAFNSIKYSGIINPNSAITLRAGYSVYLNNFSEVNPLTTVYTQPIVCNNNLISISRDNANSYHYLISETDYLIPNRIYPPNTLAPVNNNNNDIYNFKSIVDKSNTESLPLKNAIIYPNPFNESITISTDPNDVVLVINGNGSEILKTWGIQKINTSNWPAGCYVVHIIDNKGESNIYKLIKAE